jgi:succinate-semialdehyde dehydrogenase / glutarate-semialdehyde dehydrogenase
VKTYPLYLNGEFVMSEPAKPVVNPSTGEPFVMISTTTRERLATALEDAHAAFRQWRRLPGKARGAYLRKIADLVESRKDEIARAITLENGKPLAQSQGEVAMTVDHLQWFAEEARRVYGRMVPNQVDNKRHLVVKTPMGVVGAISPWNFPLALAVRKIAPALAAGCTVVLKPATQTPVCAALFAECVHAAGLPKGVFQMIVGPSPAFGDELLSNPLCRKITFTGSTEVGRVLIKGAAATVKPLSLELGGHAPVLVFADADLNVAVEGAAMAKFRNTGQSCIAANRVLVERPIYEQFLEAFAAKARSLKVGDGLEPGVDIGPLIDQAGIDKATEHVQDAVAKGARLMCGGKRVPGRAGFFFEPTVLGDVPPTSACMREETFAPIAPVCMFDTEEEALEQANASIYGLSAYAFTQNLDRAFRLMEGLEAGTIGINDGVPTTSQCPFGGVKQSGWGRELGIEGLDAFLETKHVALGIKI